MSQEPSGADGPNLYWYGKNNPTKNIDRLGLQSSIDVEGGADVCGSSSNGSEWVPDEPLGNDFRLACIRHDNCNGNPGASRMQCDYEFYGSMMTSCQSNNVSTQPFCQIIASGYFRIIQWMGQDAFDSAQNPKCEPPPPHIEVFVIP